MDDEKLKSELLKHIQSLYSQLRYSLDEYTAHTSDVRILYQLLYLSWLIGEFEIHFKSISKVEEEHAKIL